MFWSHNGMSLISFILSNPGMTHRSCSVLFSVHVYFVYFNLIIAKYEDCEAITDSVPG